MYIELDIKQLILSNFMFREKILEYGEMFI